MHDPPHDAFLAPVPVRLEAELEVVGPDELAAQAAHGTDEAHDELVRRLLVEVARPADLLDVPVVHEHDPVGDVHRLLLIVRDEDGGHMHLVMESPQPRA